MIIDTFMFCHELDMLEVRLRTYYDYVDQFVILECDHTHQNTSKPLYFEENKERFAWALPKIKHVIHKGKFPDSTYELEIENRQRNILYQNCPPCDVMFVSDVDEFYPREDIEWFRKNALTDVMVWEHDFYYYNTKCPRNRISEGTLAIPSFMGVNCMGHLRSIRYKLPRTRGGWHFSYFMNHEEIVTKLASFCHDKYNQPPFTDKDYVEDHIQNNLNFLGKEDAGIKHDFKEPLGIPEYLMAELSKYPIFVGTV